MPDIPLYDGKVINIPDDLPILDTITPLSPFPQDHNEVVHLTLEWVRDYFGADSWTPIVENGVITSYKFFLNGSDVGTMGMLPGNYVAEVKVGGQKIHQLVDSQDNYLYVYDTAGHGQPKHSEEPGQTLFTDGTAHYVKQLEDGRFVPASKYDDGAILIPSNLVVDSTSLHVGKYATVSILDRIFRLLTLVLESMQRLASNQAQRLTFLTAWQRAYTDVMNQIHPFVAQASNQAGSLAGIHFGGDDTQTKAAGDRRQSMNDKNSNWTEVLRGNRQLIADDAKALQSLINQSNDAVSQQSNMATSILQQFSTILGSIYR